MTNAAANDQHTFWNEVQGPKWVRLQERIDRTLNSHGDAAMERLAARLGEHILDVGCGYGTTSLALASRVGTDGSVTGADISRPMLDHARARAKAASAALNLVEANVQVHDFEGETFDGVFSRFGVMFFADFEAAFANLLRATKSGGRLAFTCWRGRADNPWAMAAVPVARPHVELPPRPAPGDPGQFAFEDEAFVRQILERSGWSGVAIDRFDADLDIGGSVAEAADFLLQMGPVAGPVAEADEATRNTITAELCTALEPHLADGRVRLGSSTWIVSARKA